MPIPCGKVIKRHHLSSSFWSLPQSPGAAMPLGYAPFGAARGRACLRLPVRGRRIGAHPDTSQVLASFASGAPTGATASATRDRAARPVAKRHSRARRLREQERLNERNARPGREARSQAAQPRPATEGTQKLNTPIIIFSMRTTRAPKGARARRCLVGDLIQIVGLVHEFKGAPNEYALRPLLARVRARLEHGCNVCRVQQVELRNPQH